MIINMYLLTENVIEIMNTIDIMKFNKIDVTKNSFSSKTLDNLNIALYICIATNVFLLNYNIIFSK